MTDKHKLIDRKQPATINIITGKDMGLVSAVLTRRKPSEKEAGQADWYIQVNIGGVACHCVGRGVALDRNRLQELAGALLAVNLPWPYEAVSVQELQAEPSTYGKDEPSNVPGIEFDNDPLWQRIVAISGGAR